MAVQLLVQESHDSCRALTSVPPDTSPAWAVWHCSRAVSSWAPRGRLLSVAVALTAAPGTHDDIIRVVNTGRAAR